MQALSEARKLFARSEGTYEALVVARLGDRSEVVRTVSGATGTAGAGGEVTGGRAVVFGSAAVGERVLVRGGMILGLVARETEHTVRVG